MSEAGVEGLGEGGEGIKESLIGSMVITTAKGVGEGWQET